MLYGGIDSKEVTERAADPSGAMGAIQRILANDVALQQTALDFSRKPADRTLFPDIEPDVVPGSSPEADAKIRRTIVVICTSASSAATTPPTRRRSTAPTASSPASSPTRRRARASNPQEIWSGRPGLAARRSPTRSTPSRAGGP